MGDEGTGEFADGLGLKLIPLNISYSYDGYDIKDLWHLNCADECKRLPSKLKIYIRLDVTRSVVISVEIINVKAASPKIIGAWAGNAPIPLILIKFFYGTRSCVHKDEQLEYLVSALREGKPIIVMIFTANFVKETNKRLLETEKLLEPNSARLC